MMKLMDKVAIELEKEFGIDIDSTEERKAIVDFFKKEGVELTAESIYNIGLENEWF